MAEKIKLSCHWTDSEGWAGTEGKRYLPGETVSFANRGHAALLRQAGYEALDQGDAAPVTAPRKRAAKKAAAKKAAAAPATSDA